MSLPGFEPLMLHGVVNIVLYWTLTFERVKLCTYFFAWIDHSWRILLFKILYNIRRCFTYDVMLIKLRVLCATPWRMLEPRALLDSVGDYGRFEHLFARMPKTTGCLDLSQE